MRRVELLITQIRKQTENEEFSDTTGIDDEEFLQYLNDAQNRLQAKILQQHPGVFLEEREIDVVSGQEGYTIAENAYLDNKVFSVEYSSTGRSDDYYPLQLISFKNRSTNIDGDPVFYSRKSGKIHMSPVPQNSIGKLRINYAKMIDHIDKRRGQVEAVTLGSGNTISSLDLDESASTSIDDELNSHDHLCVVDRYGTIKMRNVEIDSVNTTSGEVTITSGFTYDDGETIEVGDYVVSGMDASTHSELPRNCERYLIAYCAWKILKRDSSADSAEQTQELLEMEQDIIDSFADIEDDIQRIPILNLWTEDDII